jgi:hypothetical protein
VIRALETVGETYIGTILAALTVVAAVAWSKRALLQKVKRARR